jgi:hypothetical protein
VTASKSAGAIDEVLMGMLRDLRKKYLKNWVYRHLLFFKTLHCRHGQNILFL